MHRRLESFLHALPLAAIVFLSGCSGGHFANTPYLAPEYQTQFVGSGTGSRPSEVVDSVSYWDGAGDGSPSITINLSEQKAYFYKGRQLAGVALVATGKEGYDTPPGTFHVIEKIRDKRSDLYGYMYDADGNVTTYDADIRRDRVPPGGHFEGAPMPYWMRIVDGIGMHQGPIPVPGSPASHGCIRMSKLVAEEFFNHAAVGMPVRVVY
ncbi:MAG: L,D-transpeptidase [Terrimicrobiaceae bacterium]|nr:L,D-transpeptidase [Terrimicrobiaceae bacterium]